METTKKIMDDLQKTSQDEIETIANITINIQERRELIWEAYTSCELCGTELDFTHVTNFISLEVTEESCCPSCNISSEKQAHGLH